MGSINSTDIPGFNLLDEPWIPVTLTDGTAREISLQELFPCAPRIQTITGELPQMSFVIVRLALAILYRAYSDDPDIETTRTEFVDLWEDLWKQGHFEDGLIEGYLAHSHNRFDLFDEEYPFFQVPGLKYLSKDASPVSELMADVPKRDKYLFSMRAPQYTNELSYAEAARYLLLAQAFDISGIKAPVEGNTYVNKGKVYAPKGAVGTGWCGAIGGVMLEGDTLFETLLFNFVLYLADLGSCIGIEDDLPPWELLPSGPDIEEREPRGPVDVLTWQSRRIRLVRDTDSKRVTGVVQCYGTILTAADKPRSEQMTAWRESKQQQKRLGTSHEPWMPLTHDPSRAIWRGLQSLISSGGKNDLRPGVVRWLEQLRQEGVLSDDQRVAIHALGMSYGTQSAVIDDVIDDTVSLHLLLVRNDEEAPEARQNVVEMVNLADEAVGKLVRFVWLVESAKGDQRRYDSFSDNQATAVKDGVREQAYEALDELFRDRIAELTSDKSLLPYCAKWRSDTRQKLLDLAREYVASSSVSMFVEHNRRTPGGALVWLEGRLSRIFSVDTKTSAQQHENQSN